MLLGGLSPPSQLVPNPFNWSPNTVFTDISATVAQIQKFQKARCICFRILLLGGPSPPSQLVVVPNPLNWSQKTVFFTDISVSVAQMKKIKKQSPFTFQFCFWEDPPHPVNWSPIHSTGPQKLFFYRNLSIGRSNQKNSKNLIHLFLNFDSGRTSQLAPNPFNWSPTHSTGPQ